MAYSISSNHNHMFRRIYEFLFIVKLNFFKHKSGGMYIRTNEIFPAIAHQLNIKILNVLRILFNEFTAGLNLIAHKN